MKFTVPYIYFCILASLLPAAIFTKPVNRREETNANITYNSPDTGYAILPPSAFPPPLSGGGNGTANITFNDALVSATESHTRLNDPFEILCLSESRRSVDVRDAWQFIFNIWARQTRCNLSGCMTLDYAVSGSANAIVCSKFLDTPCWQLGDALMVLRNKCQLWSSKTVGTVRGYAVFEWGTVGIQRSD